MKKAIWKFVLNDIMSTVEMPKGTDILCMQLQGLNTCLWALCNPDAETEKRTFLLVGTGHEFDYIKEDLLYIGTYQIPPFVWHIFEVGYVR